MGFHNLRVTPSLGLIQIAEAEEKLKLKVTTKGRVMGVVHLVHSTSAIWGNELGQMVITS